MCRSARLTCLASRTMRLVPALVRRRPACHSLWHSAERETMRDSPLSSEALLVLARSSHLSFVRPQQHAALALLVALLSQERQAPRGQPHSLAPLSVPLRSLHSRAVYGEPRLSECVSCLTRSVAKHEGKDAAYLLAPARCARVLFAPAHVGTGPLDYRRGGGRGSLSHRVRPLRTCAVVLQSQLASAPILCLVLGWRGAVCLVRSLAR